MKSIDQCIPEIIGDYPYYRDSLELWEPKLKSMYALGIECVSCYVPWRHHEDIDTGVVDFSGAGNKNLFAFLDLISSIGMSAILKPGPFIHAEVAFGGLPDRLCAKRNKNVRPLVYANGEPMQSEGRVFPHYSDSIFVEESIEWLKQFSSGVFERNQLIKCPVVAIQLGNEGVFSDSNSVVPSFYSDVSGKTIYDELYSKWLDALNINIPILTNYCPPKSSVLDMGDGDIRYAIWARQVNPKMDSRLTYGFSSWIGHPIQNLDSLFSILLAAKRSDGINMEENGGFIWDDDYWSEAASFCQSTAIMIGAGAKGVSLYPAVATRHWTKSIDTLIADLSDSPERYKYYAKPYGDACAIFDSGEINTKKYKYISEYFNFLKNNREIFSMESTSKVIVVIPEFDINQDLVDVNMFFDEVKKILLSVGIDFLLQEESSVEVSSENVYLRYGDVERYSENNYYFNNGAFNKNKNIDLESDSLIDDILFRTGFTDRKGSFFKLERKLGRKRLLTFINIGNVSEYGSLDECNGTGDVEIAPKSVKMVVLDCEKIVDEFSC